MSHKTVYMGIPAKKLGGTFDLERIKELVAETMEHYVEATAAEENTKCDWYEIGGRWAGAVGAIKGVENVLPSEKGLFAYQLFDQYDAIVNNGRRGPYCVDEVEYIPVNAGLKKCISWDCLEKLNEFMTYKFLEMVLNRDSRIGTELPENYEIKNSDLFYTEGEQSFLLLKNGESFSDRTERMKKQFGRAMMQADAYIDTNGIWHDDNDAWVAYEEALMRGENPKIPLETAQDTFLENFEKFMDEELQDDDCFVILDCHCFP